MMHRYAVSKREHHSRIASANALINLAVTQPDNNVKLIVLDRLSTLHEKYSTDLNGNGPLVLDLLGVLSSPDMEVKKKCISIALSMITSRNVEEVVDFLKKQLLKTVDSEYEKVSLLSSALRVSAT